MCEHTNTYLNFIQANTIKLEDVELLHNGRHLPFVNGNAKIIRAVCRASLLSGANQIGIKCIIKGEDIKECERQRRALDRELAVWCGLENPNVLSLSGIITLDRSFSTYVSPSAVFEYYEHGDITRFIRSTLQPDERTRVRLLYDVVQGLAYLHGEGIIHGDIKSANVVIHPDLKAQICDFGSSYMPKCSDCVARPPDQFHYLKQSLYLSPELWVDQDNDPPTTQESDIWALGCVLLEVQIGIPPYKTENDRHGCLALMKQLNQELPANINDFSGNAISTAIGVIAFECWIREPEDRPSAQDVLDMLHEACELF